MNFEETKARLINEIEEMGAFKNKKVKEAFLAVPRENFVPADMRKFAYSNYPLPIGEQQTISQPYTVAVMTEALELDEGMKVLEVGTGSGYQTAILSHMVGKEGKVFSCEIREELFVLSRERLKPYKNVTIAHIDGSKGYAKEAPFDRIIVTAAGKEVPSALENQLKEGGVLVMPIHNEMIVAKKVKGELERKMIGYFAFVPLKED